jgi:hypothetical protein
MIVSKKHKAAGDVLSDRTLLSMGKALGSIPSTTHTQNSKNKKQTVASYLFQGGKERETDRGRDRNSKENNKMLIMQNGLKGVEKFYFLKL